MRTLLLVLFTLFVHTSVYSQKPFVFGSESLIPFEFQEDDRPSGINIEIIDLIMKKLNVPYEIQFGEVTGKRALDKAKSGEIDAILSVSYRPERNVFLKYPDGFENEKAPNGFMWVSEYVFFAKSANVAKYQGKSFDVLKGMDVKVGIIKGVSYDDNFRKSGLTLVEASGDEENFKKLMAGEIDLYITDRIIGRYTSNKMGFSKEISALSGIILSKPYTIAMVRASKHPDMAMIEKRFYEELELLKKSGVARRLVMKYLYQ